MKKELNVVFDSVLGHTLEAVLSEILGKYKIWNGRMFRKKSPNKDLVYSNIRANYLNSSDWVGY